MKSYAKYAREAGPWGVSAIAVAVAVAALGLSAATRVNPVDEAADRVGEPVAESLGVLKGQCPGGWQDESVSDEHAVVRSCSREVDGVTWLVILDEAGDFSHGFPKDTPGAEFVFEPEGVPRWP
jgi:hypothetical protein